MRKAFTLIELVVAIALLAIVFSFAGVVFKVSIDSYRTAVANSEIMQQLRAITDQLNADFEGIRTDAPLLFWFEQDPNDTRQRFDQIMFFANGDFQSIQLYDGPAGFEVPAPTGYPIVGNIARVFYGQAQSRDRNENMQSDPIDLLEEDRLLARRRHILTADTDVDEWPDANMSDFGNGSGADKLNEWYEHDSLSLAKWKTIGAGAYDSIIIDTCFEFRPFIDTSDPNTFHKLMCEGVSSFAIQWAYWDSDDKQFYWFPSDDPDGSGSFDDSHFHLICPVCDELFGVYFNIPNGYSFGKWYPIGNSSVKYRSGEWFLSDFYPKAIKFTFRLYDSRGIIEEGGRAGREFTHIVYLGD